MSLIKENFGLFVGLASITGYSNSGDSSFDITDFERDVVNETFKEFRQDLTKNTTNEGPGLDENLYRPINFYAFGYYNLISISPIDDFHFGNFSFRPYNKYLRNEVERERSNFQFQVINGYNLQSKQEDVIATLSKSNFISVCKLKINSSLVVGVGHKLIEKIIQRLVTKEFCDEECSLLIFESFSWHEISIIFVSASLSKIFDRICKIRKATVKTFELTSEDWHGSLAQENLFNKEAEETIREKIEKLNIFTDTESIFGISPEFFHPSGEGYVRDYDQIYDLDRAVRISTKVQMKTGHGAAFDGVLKRNEALKTVIEAPIRVSNGRSDYSIKFKKSCIDNYIKFWRLMLFDREVKNTVFSNTRKIHSNLNIDFLDEHDTSPETGASNKLFKSLKFSGKKIQLLEASLQKLKVSKEVGNSVLALYTNFNDIICDINLYNFYLDLRSLLENLQEIVLHLSSNKRSSERIFTEQQTFAYRRVSEISKLLLSYIELYKNAYSNRFLDSKRNGYNFDIKGEFSGGVHQVIHAYDSLFKIVWEALSIVNPSTKRFNLPIATFGSYENGIKSTINNLHINYFQLFQPEFFLFSLIKESMNNLLDNYWLSDQDEGGVLGKQLLNLGKIRKQIATSIHAEPSLDKKHLLFEYLPPDKIKTKINYILYYTLFIKILWEDDIKAFTFWLWHSYIQTSNLYNIDGSLNMALFKEHFFAFYAAVKYIGKLPGESVSMKLTEYINEVIFAPDLKHYIFDNNSSGRNILDECEEVYDHLTMLEGDGGSSSILDPWGAVCEVAEKSKLKALENGDYYLEVHRLIKKHLGSFMDQIIISKGTISNYVREPSTGIGLRSEEYKGAVFDPHGGLFVRDTNLRREFLAERVELINEARDISFRYKKNLYPKP